MTETENTNLTPAEVAKELRISVRTVQRYIKSGYLEGLQVGKKYIIPAEALQRFKTQHTVKATDPTA